MVDSRDEEEAEVTLTTVQIERIVTNFVASQGGVRTPFVYTIKWLWSIDKGPLCHVKVSKAPANVRPTPMRLVSKKDKQR